MTYVDQYYLDADNFVHFLSAKDQEQATTNHLDFPKSDWTEITATQAAEITNPPLTKDQTIAIYELAAQNVLESVAVTWGYSSMLAAVSYVSSANAQYKADAEALIAWRDSYWAEAYTLEAGTLPATADAFVALLPEAPSKPVI